MGLTHKKNKKRKEGSILAVCSRAVKEKKKEKKEPAVYSRVYKRKKKENKEYRVS
jgi:hypothetical protein